MKKLKEVLHKYEQESQKVISSLEKNRIENAKKLVKKYMDFNYITVLDNSTKSQVAFSRNANNLLEIEKKELTQLENFKIVKETLINEKETLEDKIAILDAIATEEQQHKFNLSNLEKNFSDKSKTLLEEQKEIKKKWERELKELENQIKAWEDERAKRLAKEEEERLYQHNLKVAEIQDAQDEKIREINREQEMKAHKIQKDIETKERELNEGAEEFNGAKEYIEKYDEEVSNKVSKLLKIKLGYIKDEHKSLMEGKERELSSQIDILSYKIDSVTKSNEEKKELIKELTEKMERAKSDLNKLIQNTLSLKE